MKKGLLVWKAPGRFKNLGDYIQSIAAEQYVGRDVIFIEREETNKYSGEPVMIIMNGWFMHRPENWPPSNKIFPLFTSFHITPPAGEAMLSEKAIRYFKSYTEKYGPVGARDKETERLFKSKGIPAYFSGCLTLTLDKSYKHNPAASDICFVDAHYTKELKGSLPALFRYFTLVLSKRQVVTKISKGLYKSTSFKALLKAAQFYLVYAQAFTDDVLKRAQFIRQLVLESTLGNEEAKLETARALLRQYANSRLVVTSRIHAALPCLAMGTPTIFILSDDMHPNGRGVRPEAKGRFEGILELLHVMENVNFKLKPVLGFQLNEKIGINHSIRNKQDHLKIAEELDKACTAFIRNANTYALER